jgi:permuted papain-like amidase YaeF/Yiix C92 family enzyme
MKRSMVLLWAVVAVGCMPFSCSDNSGGGADLAIHKLEPGLVAARIDGGLKTLAVYRKGLATTVAFVHSETELFPAKTVEDPRMLTREQREAARRTWQTLLDYYLALDSVGKYHSTFYKVSGKERRADSFLVCYGAFLAQYRYAMDFIARVENDPGFDTLLNEPVPELGLPKDSYADFKYRFLNVARATEFVAMNTVNKWYGGKSYRETRKAIEEDKAAIWAMGKGKGELLTLKNGLNILRKAGGSAWLPVQAGVAGWMGDTKVWRRGQSLISEEQIATMQPRLRPGDVMLQRREWYMSNVGLPGFWTHVAMVVGTPDERRAFFDDAGVKAWVVEQGRADGDFEALLKDKYPKAYALCTAPQEGGHLPRVMEAIGEGVSFTTLEHSAAADSLVALRPKLPKKEIAMAIRRAFHYTGRPYDFSFDFLTDSELVCSELVYKAYEPAGKMKGLTFELTTMMGKLLLPPNEITRVFDKTYGTDKQQFDFVLFFDGHEDGKTGVESTLKAFRATHTRPKWHIITQDKPEERGGK